MIFARMNAVMSVEIGDEVIFLNEGEVFELEGDIGIFDDEEIGTFHVQLDRISYTILNHCIYSRFN